MWKIFCVVVFAHVLLVCHTKDCVDKLDRFRISCHSTDFVCFQRQYQSLRDHFLLGNSRLHIEDFTPYYVKYGDSGTCIKISGLEESQLAGIVMNGFSHRYSLTLELPLRIQQVPIENTTLTCLDPEHAFGNMTQQISQTGPFRKFTGNATIRVTYPYELKKKKGDIHMILGEENLDVTLDIPDLEELKNGNSEEKEQYDLSEWAYEVVQHIDAAQHFAMPYTTRLRNFTEYIPLDRLLLLYPEEEYTEIHFKFSESQLDSRNPTTLSSTENTENFM